MDMTKYYGSRLKETICIKELYTVHYFEYSKNYSYGGESHDFWEFVYVDKGEIIITADDKDYRLTSGQVFFHKPNQWHALRSNGEIAPNLVVVSFSCTSSAMSFFDDKLFFFQCQISNTLINCCSQLTVVVQMSLALITMQCL